MSEVGHKSLVTLAGSLSREGRFHEQAGGFNASHYSLPASQPWVENNEVENILNIIKPITTRISGRGREEGRVQMSPLLL